MVFEEVVELLVAEQVGDAGADSVGVLGVAALELDRRKSPLCGGED